jgi:dTDP-glucose pyrophosphorylase
MSRWKEHLIPESYTIREAMMRLNDLGIVNADVFVTDRESRLLGSVSDGDIRRALIRGVQTSEGIHAAMNPQCTTAKGLYPDLETVERCKQRGIRFLPLLNEAGAVIRVVDVDQLLGIVPVEAVIMAGGEGRRLRPLTDTLPKPLLPVGGKPIIEHNIDRLIKFGITHIRISINYLGHLLQAHFGDGGLKNIHIDYIREEKPLGTAGAIATVQNWHTEHVLVLNSDVLTDIDYADFYKDFAASNADLAIAAIPYSVNIPYAVLEQGKGNEILALAEKPTYTYYSNAGIYLVKRSVLKYIPADCCYNMTDLVEEVMKRGHKVISYPIRGYWLDIGKMHDYEKAQEDIKHLKL